MVVWVVYKYLTLESQKWSPVLLANTVMHSLDHYNLSKYFLQDNEPKVYGGVDVRLFSSIFVDHNHDLGKWQYISHARDELWKSIYDDLKEIDEDLANYVHKYVCI